MKDLMLQARLVVTEPHATTKNLTTRSKIAQEGSWLRQNHKCNVDYSQEQIVWHHFKKTKSFLKFRLLTKPHLLLYIFVPVWHHNTAHIWEATWHWQCLQFELHHQASGKMDRILCRAGTASFYHLHHLQGTKSVSFKYPGTVSEQESVAVKHRCM